MARFNPSMLVPAQAAPEFSKNSAQRTLQQIVLDNINRTKEQWAAGDGAEGRRSFRIAGDKVSFSIRVNNTALVLGTYERDGVSADVREMVVPKANFTDALDYFADKVRAGEYQAQLEAMSGRREARTIKMRATRAARKTGDANKA